jgi:hypothetical protein
MPDEILFRILQVSTASASITLLITCMTMDGVKWWLPVPIYALAFMCMVTFLTTFFMRAYSFDMAVITIMMLAIAGVAVALHSYIQPISRNRREALNRRILFWTLPIVGVFLCIWVVGVAFDGGSEYFVRIEQTLRVLMNNQEKMMARQDTLEAKVEQQSTHDLTADSSATAYRKKLDKNLEKVNDRLDNQSLRLHRLTTDEQKRFQNR